MVQCEEIYIKQIIKNAFCYELKVTLAEANETLWVILVYASTDSGEKKEQ